MALATIGKASVLKQYVFRNSNPAIFGVEIKGGKLRAGLSVISNTGEKIGHIKNIQSENNSIGEALEGMQVAMSIPGVNFERELGDKDFLYSDISASQFRTFKKNKDLLSENEMKILQEIAEIKRRKEDNWGV